jgi:hypothetical protein
MKFRISEYGEELLAARLDDTRLVTHSSSLANERFHRVRAAA